MTRRSPGFFAASVMLFFLTGCGSQPQGLPSTDLPSSASAGATSPSAGPTAQGGGGSLVRADGGVIGDLGEADYGQKKSYTFKIRNDSGTPLNLYVSEKSCECAGVELKPARLDPNQTGEVVVSWAPKLDQSTQEAVRVRATVQAQEPPGARLGLEARGQIKPALHVNLPRGRLDFGPLQVADVKSGIKELPIEIYTQDPNRKGFSLQAKVTGKGLLIEPAQPIPLPPNRLSVLNAFDGYRINIRCADGLPIGSFREVVQLKTDVYPDRDLEVAVEGRVESGAVSVQPAVADLPEKIPLSRGYRCPPIEVTLRGEPGRKLQFQKAEPGFLKVQVEPVMNRENTWRVLVTVPTGAELQTLLTPEQLSDSLSFGFDAGAIELHSDHSKVPVLRIPVSASQFQR